MMGFGMYGFRVRGRKFGVGRLGVLREFGDWIARFGRLGFGLLGVGFRICGFRIEGGFSVFNA